MADIEFWPYYDSGVDWICRPCGETTVDTPDRDFGIVPALVRQGEQ